MEGLGGKKMININVEEIMQQIRDEIKEKGYKEEMLSFSDLTVGKDDLSVRRFNKTMFNESLDFLNRGWKVQPYRMFDVRSLKSKITTFGKKVIRKFIKFYIEPITADQNRFNASVVRLFNLMQCYMKENRENEQLQSQVKQLLTEQEKLKKELDELKQVVQQNRDDSK